MALFEVWWPLGGFVDQVRDSLAASGDGGGGGGGVLYNAGGVESQLSLTYKSDDGATGQCGGGDAVWRRFLASTICDQGHVMCRASPELRQGPFHEQGAEVMQPRGLRES